MDLWNAVITVFINVLLYIYDFVGNNFGLAIIFFTLLIRLVTYPLNAKQMKSTQAMQDLQQSEEWQKIQKKYKIKTEEEDEGEKLQITGETSQEVIDAHIRERAEKLYGHVDAVKYVPDLMGLLINMPEMAEQAFFPYESLSDLKIDGDHATGKAGEKVISFIREDGRWYLTADVMD